MSAPFVACRVGGLRPKPGLTFDWRNARWRIICAHCAVRLPVHPGTPADKAPPLFMDSLERMRAEMHAVLPGLRASGRVQLGVVEVARAYYDAVLALWPYAEWLVHDRPEAPVLAVSGWLLVAGLAPIVDDSIVARLKETRS